MNLLTAEGITHSYHDRRLFSGLSFHLNEGEKVGLIGINGTGKSTLYIRNFNSAPEDYGR